MSNYIHIHICKKDPDVGNNGTLVGIAGSGFEKQTNASGCKFGDVFAPAFTVMPATRIYVYAPPPPSGVEETALKVNVECTNDGKSFSKGRHIFTYV